MAVDANSIFKAVSKTPQELLSDTGLGLYIPSYQRPYSWDKNKVSRLIEDLGHGVKTLLKHDDSFTFLGTVITIHDTNNVTVQPIVKEDVPSKVLTVIDGQQRMTTLLILCLALHNQIQFFRKTFLRKMKQIEKTLSEEGENLSINFGEEFTDEIRDKLEAYEWLDGQVSAVLDLLSKTFYEKQSYGKCPLYPRMIRSLDDQWSKNDKNKKYDSPVANLIFNYICLINEVDYAVTEYKPVKREGNIEGEDAVIDRFLQLSRLIASLTGKKAASSEMEEVPSIEEIYESEQFQESLLGHSIQKRFLECLHNEEKAVFDDMLVLVLYSNYVLKRVVLTVVQGKNEDYAFTIFESLNTTGEPLTAFETFKPRVVSAVGLENYSESEEKRYMDQTASYLSEFNVGEGLQKATKELLIQFLGAYSGDKVSGRLAEQRSKLKTSFEELKTPEDRMLFIRTLTHCANFKKDIWHSKHNYENLNNYFDSNQLSQTGKLCLKFLADINHSIVIPVLTIFFKQVVEEKDIELKKHRFDEFEGALKAVTAFSVLWRSSRDGTAGIDNEYRELLSKESEFTDFYPIAIRLNKDSSVNLDTLKAELKSRLQDAKRKGKIIDKEAFIQNSFTRPIYKKAPKVAKVLLLAAHHDSIEPDDKSGLLKKGRVATNNCLTYENYIDDTAMSLEHIAPQNNAKNWDGAIYEIADTVHTLGNLTLVSHSLNSALSNRMWAEKQVFYKVIGARTHQEAAEILRHAAESNGISFKEHSHEILTNHKYMPNLVALGDYAGSWTKEFIEERSKHLYGLAWDELIKWLE